LAESGDGSWAAGVVEVNCGANKYSREVYKYYSDLRDLLELVRLVSALEVEIGRKADL
jgi:hypothetical protein